MGMNLPVRRIVFSALSKFIDDREHPLSFSEVKQIAGRAGRFNRFPVGEVTTLNRVEDGLRILNDALAHHLGQQDKAMVGPDLDIFSRVNHALESHSLPTLSLSEFLRLFNTMTFQKPFYCVDMKEMIELAEMVEGADENRTLSYAEIFGFACAPVNLGLMEHVQYYMWILNHYVASQSIVNEDIDETSDNIDYLETSIKCVELFQWLSRHFNQKNFSFDERQLLDNKAKAIERLNSLLSEKISKTCSSCGCKMPANARFNICDDCFAKLLEDITVKLSEVEIGRFKSKGHHRKILRRSLEFFHLAPEEIIQRKIAERVTEFVDSTDIKIEVLLLIFQGSDDPFFKTNLFIRFVRIDKNGSRHHLNRK